MRKVKIIMPMYRPFSCLSCPLCGTRPREETIDIPGNKWTRICLLDHHVMSGRGVRQPNARNRCKKKEYERMFFRGAGVFEISYSLACRYGITEQKLLFAPEI